jgi:hypothetical protein
MYGHIRSNPRKLLHLVEGLAIPKLIRIPTHYHVIHDPNPINSFLLMPERPPGRLIVPSLAAG